MRAERLQWIWALFAVIAWDEAIANDDCRDGGLFGGCVNLQCDQALESMVINRSCAAAKAWCDLKCSACANESVPCPPTGCGFAAEPTVRPKTLDPRVAYCPNETVFTPSPSERRCPGPTDCQYHCALPEEDFASLQDTKRNVCTTIEGTELRLYVCRAGRGAHAELDLGTLCPAHPQLESERCDHAADAELPKLGPGEAPWRVAAVVPDLNERGEDLIGRVASRVSKFSAVTPLARFRALEAASANTWFHVFVSSGDRTALLTAPEKDPVKELPHSAVELGLPAYCIGTEPIAVARHRLALARMTALAKSSSGQLLIKDVWSNDKIFVGDCLLDDEGVLCYQTRYAPDEDRGVPSTLRVFRPFSSEWFNDHASKATAAARLDPRGAAWLSSVAEAALVQAPNGAQHSPSVLAYASKERALLASGGSLFHVAPTRTTRLDPATSAAALAILGVDNARVVGMQKGLVTMLLEHPTKVVLGYDVGHRRFCAIDRATSDSEPECYDFGRTRSFSWRLLGQAPRFDPAARRKVIERLRAPERDRVIDAVLNKAISTERSVEVVDAFFVGDDLAGALVFSSAPGSSLNAALARSPSLELVGLGQQILSRPVRITLVGGQAMPTALTSALVLARTEIWRDLLFDLSATANLELVVSPESQKPRRILTAGTSAAKFRIRRLQFDEGRKGSVCMKGEWQDDLRAAWRESLTEPCDEHCVAVDLTQLNPSTKRWKSSPELLLSPCGKE